MPRIKGKKPGETRAAAIAAAVETFAELGYENATLAMIAERAGVTAATLPYHFRDKQGLWDAVIESFYSELLSFGQTMLDVPSLDVGLAQVYDWSVEHRSGIRVIIRHVIETGALAKSVRELRMDKALALVTRAVAERFQTSETQARDAAVAVTHLVTRFVTNSADDNRKAFAVATDVEARARIVAILVCVAKALIAPR